MTVTAIKERGVPFWKRPISFTSIIDLFLALYITSIYILSYDATLNAFSKALALVLMGLLAIYLFSKKTFRLDGLTVFFGLFILVCMLSCLWAVDVDEATQKVSTLLQIFVLTFLMYNYLQKEGKIEFLVSVMCIAGTIFAVYTVLYFGVSEYFAGLEEGIRMGSEVTNVNTIGMVTASAAIMALWKVMYNKKKFYLLSIGVCVVVAFGTGSRKALLLLIVGIVLLFVLKGNAKKKLGSLLQLAAVLLVLYAILQLPIFVTINERMSGLFNLFTGEGEVESSAQARFDMIDAGWQQFLKTPFTGVGIGNSYLVTDEALGRSVYLHNNYVELLASVGIFGALFYYLLYITPAFSIVKLALKQNKFAILAITLLIIELALQYGAVQYYGKTPYIYVILFFLVANMSKQDNTPQKYGLLEQGQDRSEII